MSDALAANSPHEAVNKSNKVSEYEWVRIIATLFVVIGHSAYLKITTTYGGVDYILPANVDAEYYSQLMKAFRILAGWVYGFHMPLFFALSGAVLHLKPLPQFDDFVKNKFIRLIVPYFIYGYCFNYTGDYMFRGNCFNFKK